MNEANLTRFGPKIFDREQAESMPYSATFRAIDGPAKLLVHCESIDSAQINVNGHSVAGPENFRGNGEIVLPLNLKKENTIEVELPDGPTGS